MHPLLRITIGTLLFTIFTYLALVCCEFYDIEITVNYTFAKYTTFVSFLYILLFKNIFFRDDVMEYFENVNIVIFLAERLNFILLIFLNVVQRMVFFFWDQNLLPYVKIII